MIPNPISQAVPPNPSERLLMEVAVLSVTCPKVNESLLSFVIVKP
jgi:hypothetical protein